MEPKDFGTRSKFKGHDLYLSDGTGPSMILSLPFRLSLDTEARLQDDYNHGNATGLASFHKFY